MHKKATIKEGSKYLFPKLFSTFLYVLAKNKVVAEGKRWTPNVGLEPTTLRLRVSCSTD